MFPRECADSRKEFSVYPGKMKTLSIEMEQVKIMELSELKLSEFVDLLASKAPAPGGGSAAALEGALGAALGGMVCSLTLGKKKYAEHEEFVSSANDKLKSLIASYMALMQRDTETFTVVSAAFRMPKTTEEEKAARSAAIQDGLKLCTQPPFEMMELAVQALEVIMSLIGKSNSGAVSDLGVAALSLKSAIQSAWLNVLINIGSFKDKELAREYRRKGEALLAKALPLADKIYDEVAAQL